MNILITGIAGFIGSHLADRLLADGHDIHGIDNLSTGRIENVPDGAHLLVADIADGVPDGCWDVIYHCAASYRDRDAWELDTRTNVLGTIAVVREAQRSGARLVYFQTSLCYGPSPSSPVDLTAPLDPRGSYAVSKTAGESYIHDSGVPFTTLRLANIYGPRNLSGPVPTFYKRLTEGRPCTVVDSRRDYVYIDDLVDLATGMDAGGRDTYHASTGSDYAIIDLYHAICSALDMDPGSPAITPRGPDDVATLLLDPSATEETFGWTATTPLDVGIAAAVAWYAEHGVGETFTHLAQKG
ncbi:MAG TPA: NAD-dependent epimerase/dehydratase family protein [Polyangia bacterium]|nr:NAD-dependent epimerase/dehydratase family protein [Polyangia bacterium]